MLQYSPYLHVRVGIVYDSLQLTLFLLQTQNTQGAYKHVSLLRSVQDVLHNFQINVTAPKGDKCSVGIGITAKLVTLAIVCACHCFSYLSRKSWIRKGFVNEIPKAHQYVGDSTVYLHTKRRTFVAIKTTKRFKTKLNILVITISHVTAETRDAAEQS